MVDHLKRKTEKYFDFINFDELSEGWIDEAIEGEFTDVEDNNMSIGILVNGVPTDALSKIADICDKWVKSEYDNALEASNSSMRKENAFWNHLDEMNLSIKQLQGVVFLLCKKGGMISSSLEEKEVGLLSAKWYFNLLRIPGSAAYSLYYPSLFRVCMDCFHVADLVESKDSSYKWRDYEEVMPMVAEALESLVPLLGTFHFGSEPSTLEYVIQKLTELAGSEVSKSNLSFDLDFLSMSMKDRSRHYGRSLIVASLAYQGFLTLMHSESNGEIHEVYSVILSYLNSHILCSRVKKNPTIPVKFVAIKNNAVAFVRYNLTGKDPNISKITLTALKRLCLSVSDKADFRNIVSNAVVDIMYDLCTEDIAELIQWILLLVDGAETNNRVFALEILGLLLTNVPQVDTQGIPESMAFYFTPLPAIYAILTRCDDVSPNVRTKALSIMSQHMARALSALTGMQTPVVFPDEEFEEGDNECNENGYHRRFWYGFTSFKDTLEEISSIFHRHIEDNNGTARKATLQALESVICFDVEYLTKENLKLFSVATKDDHIVMRKQTVQSLTAILERYPNNLLAQEYWLRCILPLVQDPENTVLAKVMGAIEEKFLLNVFSGKAVHQEAAFCLLKRIASGEFLSHQRYLQKAFSFWKADGKLRPQMAAQLEGCLGCGNDEMVWLYLSIFAAFCKLPPRMCQLSIDELENPLNWEKASFLDYILKVIGFTFSYLPPEKLESCRIILMQKLEAYAAPVEVLPIVIAILYKIEKHLGRMAEFTEFSSSMIQSSMDILTPFVSLARNKNVSSDELAAKCFAVVKELFQIFPENITQSHLNIFKRFVYPTSDSIRSAATEKVTATLQAHAYAALGMISFQEENLARELMPYLVKELLHSKEDRIRNNVVIILIEMCKRYTSLADKYIPLISACFKDKRFIIRYQSVTLIVSLLQEGFIKCKEALLFCLLSLIIDKKEAIQELGKYCLLELLHAKTSSIFKDNFVESIFVFNCYQPPEREELAPILKQLQRFALRYDEKREQRMQIYRFMLNHMPVSSKAPLIEDLCRRVMEPIADEVYPLDNDTESILRDLLAIFNSKEIRAYDSEAISNDVEEIDEETVVKAEVTTRKMTLVVPVMAVVNRLFRNKHADKENALLIRNIQYFLVEFLQDYKEEAVELFEDNKTLLMQFRLDCQTLQAKDKMTTKNEKTMKNIVSIPGQHWLSKLNLSEVTQSQPANLTNTNISDNNHVEDENAMDTSNPIYPSLDDPLLSSTPRVVLKPISKRDFPNISRIAVEDSDDKMNDDE